MYSQTGCLLQSIHIRRLKRYQTGVCFSPNVFLYQSALNSGLSYVQKDVRISNGSQPYFHKNV